MLSAKPVITCRDSGATLEFVEHGTTGFIEEPDAGAIAARIDALAANPRSAHELGAAGLENYRRLDLSWARTASVLLEDRRVA
jgi:glycosyltransferase involved in cell wall biosynthesis